MKDRAEGSTVPRRQLGRELRRLRQQAAITIEQAAHALEWSGPKVWRIEKGASPMRALDVEAMCRLYGAPEQLTGALMELAGETRATGWWHANGSSVPDWFELYTGLEQAAAALRVYETALVPGLLQTAGYATEAIRAGRPDTPPEEVERRVMARLRRQRLLARPAPIGPPRLDVILDGAVLLRMPEDPRVSQPQRDHLVRMARRPGVSVRVLPVSAGLHRAARLAPFTILDFPMSGGKPSEPTTIYVEGLTGALYLDKPHEIKEYDEVWSAIADVCLDEKGSIAIIGGKEKD